MAGARKLTLQIFGNAKSAVKALGETGTAAVGMGSKVASALPSLKTIGIAGAAAFAGVAAGAYKAVQAAADDQKSFALLESQLKSTVGATDAQVAGVEKQIGAMMRATGIADDKLRPAFANLVRGTNSVADSQELMQLALDVSAGTGKDLESVSIALSKAYGGNMMALSRLGVPLDENIKKSKDSKGALDQLSATFAGQADVAADTFGGRLQIMNTSLGEVTESVGYALLPSLTSAVGFITSSVLPVLGGFSDALTTGGLEGGLRFVATKIKETAPQVLTALLNFIKMAGEWIRSTGFPLFVEYLQFLATAITGWIKPRIPMIIEQIKEFVMSMVNWLLNTGLPFLVEKVQKLGDALVGWIGDAARNIPHQLVNFLAVIAEWLLTNALPKLAELGGKLLVSLISWTFSLGKDLIIGIGGAVVALVAALPNLFMALLTGLASIGVSAVKFFMSKFSDLSRAIAELAIGAVNFLIEQFNKIPLIPNIKPITIDLKKAQTQMGLTATEMKTVSTGMKSFSDAAYGAKTATTTLKTGINGLNLSLGAGGGGGGGGAKKATDDAKKALETYISAMRATTGASKGVVDATKNVIKANTDLATATKNVATAQARFNTVTKGFSTNSKEVVEQTRSLADAQRALIKANISASDSVKAITVAETALKKLREGTNPYDIETAEIRLQKSKYDVEQANFAILDAEKDLADLRKDKETTPQEIRRAEIKLAEAKFGVRDAVESVRDAEKELVTLRKNTPTLAQIESAERDVADAKESAADAALAQADAQAAVNTEQMKLNELTDGAKIGSVAYTEALDDLNEAKENEAEATDRVTDAIERETDAKEKLAEAERKLRIVKRETKDSIEREGDAIIASTTMATTPTVAAVGSNLGREHFTPEQAGAIDAAAKAAGGFFSGATQDYIDQLQSGSLGGASDTLNALKILLQQGQMGVTPFASGGIVTKAMLGMVGEQGAEAIIPLDRLDGFGNTYNIQVTAGMGADGKDIGTEIVNALKRYERTNGALPLTVQ